MNIVIQKAELSDLELLMKWRMEVLREVFFIPAEQSAQDLEKENESYYRSALSNGSHIACFARTNGKVIGCGGVCLYREMPSPDNPNGGCAYLMNIYTCPEFRGHGVGRKIVSWLIRQAKEQGVRKIYLETSDCGRFLYQEMGFSDMDGYMKLNAKE